jgi:hypothetical protein
LVGAVFFGVVFGFETGAAFLPVDLARGFVLGVAAGFVLVAELPALLVPADAAVAAVDDAVSVAESVASFAVEVAPLEIVKMSVPDATCVGAVT